MWVRAGNNPVIHLPPQAQMAEFQEKEITETCAIQYGGHQPHGATEHLRSGRSQLRCAFIVNKCGILKT